MADESATGDAGQVPEGAAVFPLIPPELGIHPLLLAALHAYVFLEGSADDVIDGPAADEAMEYVVGYLQRLQGDDLRRVREDMAALVDFGRDEGWPKQQQQFLKSFLVDNGIGTEEA
jgi:hypothetical protein